MYSYVTIEGYKKKCSCFMTRAQIMILHEMNKNDELINFVKRITVETIPADITTLPGSPRIRTAKEALKMAGFTPLKKVKEETCK